MGDQVKTVLVDGEEFFGDDPGMAVKNLRADAVKEVQVYDKKSEQAEFTGIDDGQKQKTINTPKKHPRYKFQLNFKTRFISNIKLHLNNKIIVYKTTKRRCGKFFLFFFFFTFIEIFHSIIKI